MTIETGGVKTERFSSKFYKTRARHQPRRLQRTFVRILIALSFFAYSVNTPAGFISAVDVALGLGFGLLCVWRVVSSDKVAKLDMLTMAKSAAALYFVFVSTVVANSGLPISPIVKYSIFLILMPLTMWLSRLVEYACSARLVISEVVLWGNLLVFWILVNIFLGQGSGGGENYAIYVVGQPVYKNQIGEYVVFVASANFLKYCIEKKSSYLLLWGLSLMLCLILDVRGPILATLAVSAASYVRFFGLGIKSAARLSFMAFLLIGVFAAILATGAFEQQVSRLLTFADVSSTGNQISSSESRVILWDFALRLISENLLFGVGHGGFFYDEGYGWLYGMYQPHNNLLQLGSEGGIIGLASFVVLLAPGFMRKSATQYELGIKFVASAYLLTTFVDIVWVRGTGHLFWFLYFYLVLRSHAVSVNNGRDVACRL